jgi:UDP-glucose 4-epimerase
MGDKQTVLITGAAGYWGARVAARLMAEPGIAVLGLDVEHPAEEIQGLDLIRADIRNPLLPKLLAAEQVDVVCHLALAGTRRPSETAFDLNVMGTTKVLGACAAAGVRKVVLKSSMAVYGARLTNSSFLTEDHPLRGSRRHAYIRNLVEVEVLCNGFRRGEPDIVLTVLRFPSIVGPTAETRMTRFLKETWAPTLMGFDPMMQIIHEDDVVEALVHAIAHDRPGVFNVAAEGVLPLSRIRGLAGKPPVAVFHLFAYWGARVLGGPGSRLARCLPMEPDYIRYPWVGDLARMRHEFGFQPRYAAEETLREFAQRFRLEHYRMGMASRIRDEEELNDILEQRRRTREGQAPAASGTQEGAARG